MRVRRIPHTNHPHLILIGSTPTTKAACCLLGLSGYFKTVMLMEFNPDYDPRHEKPIEDMKVYDILSLQLSDREIADQLNKNGYFFLVSPSTQRRECLYRLCDIFGECVAQQPLPKRLGSLLVCAVRDFDIRRLRVTYCTKDDSLPF